jgi:hypothetical protein
MVERNVLPNDEKLFEVESKRPIRYGSVLLHLNSSSWSKDVWNMLFTLRETADEEIFNSEVVQKYLDYLWKKNSRLQKLFALLYTALVILISIWVGFKEDIMGI